jgi:hypothetical protein
MKKVLLRQSQRNLQKVNKGGGGASTALTEAQRLANELARLKIQAERR